jgi:serine-type D-Ala-D-Ala carboxypeptidase (penicillin-binding protein 5/6)
MGSRKAWLPLLRARRSATNALVTNALATTALVTSVLLTSATAAPADETSPATVGGAKLASTGLIIDAAGAKPLPKLSAGSFLLADLTTGDVLAARNPHGRLRPASTLKVLTAITVLPLLDPNTVYTAQSVDANAEGSRVGVVPDATYTVHQLFQGMFLMSGNDAASALANAAGGQHQTVARMNATAKRLGALDTTARNPSGLDAPGQYTSAYDLALFARAGLARQDFRDYVTTVKTEFPGKMGKNGKARKSFQIYTQDRLLLNYRGAIGVKTGWTTKARGTFVGAATRNGHTLIATVMHTKFSSWTESRALLNWGFANIANARPVGTLNQVKHVTQASSVRPSGATPRTTATAAAATTGHGLPLWAWLPIALLFAVIALRARVLLRQRAMRQRRRLPPRRAY